jgi:WD40 repeat protein
MKKVIFVTGLVLGVSLTVVAIGYVLSSQIEYVDLLEKTITISDEDDVLFINNSDDKVVFRYSVESWRGQVKGSWDKLFQGFFEGEEIGPDNFVRFTAVSPFPEGIKTIVFAISTKELPNNYSLFFTLNVGTKQLKFLGGKNEGVVGNVVWSPEENYFAYILNSNDRSGVYLTVDNIKTMRKEFTLSKDDILEGLEIEEEENFNPEFRALRWSEDGSKIFFMTNTNEEDIFSTWSIGFDGSGLKLE